MKGKEKRKIWLKPRHRVIRDLASLVLGPYVRIRYNIKIKKFRPKDERPYLILSNHQTGADQFIVGMVVPRPIYYLASEDLFSNGFISKLLRFAVAPIPIKKQTSDVQAVRNCIKVAREGGTIAIFPEGNRTFSGRTEYMKPAIAKLARSLKVPVAFMRIEGGYGVQPRWSDCVRRGKMRAYVSRVMEPEEVRALSDKEFYELVCRELYRDEAVVDGIYAHKKTAEYLERVMYVCPYCGLSEFESRDDIIRCKRCDRKIKYLPSKELEGVGFTFPFRFVAQWYEHQCDFMNALDVSAMTDEPIYRDRVQFSRVILYKTKELLDKNAVASLYGDRITVDTAEGQRVLDFESISVITVLGRNKLNIYHGDDVYQFKSDKRFNAVKYMNVFYRKKHIDRGENDDKFLGL